MEAYTGACAMGLILTIVDVKNLKTYQQLYLYFIPMFTNLGFINIVVVIARLYWFEKSIERNGESFTSPTRRSLAHAIPFSIINPARGVV